MTPPKPPEDHFTNTVEDAAQYETWRARLAGEYDDDPNDKYDDYTEEEDEEDEDYDTCGCSDPGCPCDGFKRGGAP